MEIKLRCLLIVINYTFIYLSNIPLPAENTAGMTSYLSENIWGNRIAPLRLCKDIKNAIYFRPVRVSVTYMTQLSFPTCLPSPPPNVS